MTQRSLLLCFYGDPNGYPPIINCVRSLAQTGWRVQLLCRGEQTHPDVEFPPEIQILRAKRRSHRPWLEYLEFIWQAVKLGRGRHSAVIGHDMHGLVPAALVSKLFGMPLVYHCHDYSENRRRLPKGSAMIKRLEGPAARSAVLTVVPDRKRAEVVRTELRLTMPLLVVPNAPRRATIPENSSLKRELQKRGREFERILIRQGRIGPGHGVENTIRSIPSWNSRSWGFVAIGPAEASFLDEVTALAENLGVSDQFVTLPVMSYDAILTYTIDAHLGHALYEPINVNHVEMGTASNKILEYMACGVPCLVSTSSSAADLVRSRGCGVAVDPQRPDDIADGINRVMSDERVRVAMGKSGKAAFDMELCYEVHFANLEKMLATIVNPR